MEGFVKKITAFIAAVATVLSLVTVSAFAVRGKWNDVVWEISDGKLSVSGANIPDCSASSAAPWQKFADGVTSITVGDGVTVIGERAFEDMSSAASVEFGKVVTIGKMAFSGCASLEKVVLSESVKTVGDAAFAECSSLKTAELPSSLSFMGEAVFEGCVSLEKINSASERYPSVGGVLTDSKSLSVLRYPPKKSGKNYIVPEGITAVSAGAFRDSAALESVDLSGVLSVGDGAFYRCTALESVKLDSAAVVGRAAFYGCSSVREISFGEKLTSIGDDAFRDCAALAVAHFDGNIPSAAEGVFFGTGAGFVITVSADSEGFGDVWLGYPVIKLGVYSGTVGGIEWKLDAVTGEMTLIGDGASPDFEYPADAPWYNYRKLIRSVSFDGITAIGKNSFRYSSLKELVLPVEVTSIGDYAFSGCEVLEKVSARGVTDIGECAFFGDASLKSVDADNCSGAVGDKAFSGCGALYWIFLGKEAPAVGEFAFDGAEASVLFYPESTGYTGGVWDSLYCEGYLAGDANGDAKANISDVAVVLRSIAKWNVTVKKVSADTNLDGKVNITDASNMLKRIAGWQSAAAGIVR